MKKTILRLLCVLLSLSLLASITACGASGYTVTGEIEDGELVVWLSPLMTASYEGNFDPIPVALSESCGFSKDVKLVMFSTIAEFQQALAQDIMTGEPPDVILAMLKEFSYKTFKSGMMTDLAPFFDYADKVGTIDKDDLITQIMDGFSFDGKLYTVPLEFNIQTLGAEPDRDVNEGLNLLEDMPDTFDAYMEKINKWLNVNGEDSLYKIRYLIPEVYLTWNNFIDYEHGTTRMDEGEIYEYFCMYMKSQATFFNDLLGLYTKATGISAEEDDMVGSDAYKWYQNAVIYQSLSSNMGYTHSSIRAASANKPDGNIQYLPYVTDAGTGYCANVSIIAAIPANAAKKEKAFAYISNAFNAETINYYEDAFPFIPMLKSVIKADINKTNYLSQAEKDALYTSLTEGDYICPWPDSNIRSWFSEFYIYDDETNTTRVTIPTRAQWDALKEKIELYLNE